MASFAFEGTERIVSGLMLFNWKTFTALLYLSLGASILGFALWSRLLAKYPAALVTPMSLGVPISGFVSAAIFLGESINTQQSVGIVLTLSGLLINTFGVRIKLFVRRLG